jgi:hypothetical protein
MFGPLLVALLGAVVVTAVHRRLPPPVSARLVSVTLAVVLVSALPTFWVLGLGYLAHLPALHARLHWCAELFGVHDPIPHWAGVAALTVSVVGAVRMWRTVASYRGLRTDQHGPVTIADDDRPFAFTLPGRGGQVVLSSALVELLDDVERDVVMAHERAHGRFRHDRYLLIARLASAAVPVVRPLTRRLQFTLERWADEAAVRACGDRSFVARTLGKVALHGVARVPALGFTGLGVRARVEALLAPAPRRPGPMFVGAIWTFVAATAVLSVYQLHHLAIVIAALCH